MQMIRSGDNRKTQLLSQLDQKNFFSVGLTTTTLSRRLTMHLSNGGPKQHTQNSHNINLTRESQVNNTKIICTVMGNLGKPLNFPLVWTRKGAEEPRCSLWYCAARFTCEKGNFALLSQSTACRAVRSFGIWRQGLLILVRRCPIPGC